MLRIYKNSLSTVTVTGDTSFSEPQDSDDATTKNYVDSLNTVGSSLTVTEAGNVSPDTGLVLVDGSSGDYILTVDDGTVAGQTVHFSMTVDGNVVTITPTTVSGAQFTSVTMDAVGENASLMWDGAGWVLASSSWVTLV